jgi:hypothetical protein
MLRFESCWANTIVCDYVQTDNFGDSPRYANKNHGKLPGPGA